MKNRKDVGMMIFFKTQREDQTRNYYTRYKNIFNEPHTRYLNIFCIIEYNTAVNKLYKRSVRIIVSVIVYSF